MSPVSFYVSENLIKKSVKERDDLCTYALTFRLKMGFICSCCYTIFIGPEDSFRIVLAVRHICKWIFCHLRFRFAG